MALIVPLLFTSCLKDNEIIGPDADGSILNIVEFYDITLPTTTANSPYAMYVPTTLDLVPQAEFDIAVSYSGVDVAPEDIVVTLAPEPSAIPIFNTSQSSSYIQMPAAAYDLPASLTIKKGEKRAFAKVIVRPTLLDQTQSNALAVKITSASFGEVSGNFGTVIYSLPIKSIWQGKYRYTLTNNFGTIDANLGGSFTEDDVVLNTVGPNRVRTNLLWQVYGGYSEYQFNSSNTDITGIAAFSGTPRVATINQVILVDPVNMIFEIRWTGIGRGVIERYERTGD